MRLATGALLLACPLLLAGCGEQQSQWQMEHEAYVAQGWELHGATYRALLDAPRESDPAGRLRYTWATELPDEIRVAGPLLLQMLVDRSNDPDAQADALDVLPYVVPTSDPSLAEPMLRGSRADSGNDATARRLLARALAGVARPDVKPAAALDALTESVDERDAELSRLHLEIVSRVAGLLTSPEQRDGVVQALAGLAGLPAVVDASYRMQRVALIGGAEATRQALAYLNEKQDPEENAWGVGLAGRLEVTDALLDYLRAALEGRAPAFHADPVSRRQAVNAYRDLVTRHATGLPLDRKVLGKLYARLVGLEESAFASDPRLAQTFADLRQELDDALGN